MLGGRTNFDGGFHTAYLGKAHAYDMHLTENRAATVLVRCEDALSNDMDYDLFGWAVGEALGLRVPAFSGIGFIGYGHSRNFGTHPAAFLYRKGNNISVFAAMVMSVPA